MGHRAQDDLSRGGKAAGSGGLLGFGFGLGELFDGDAVALGEGLEAAGGAVGEVYLALEDGEGFELVGEEMAALLGGGAGGVVADEIQAGGVEGVGDLAVRCGATLTGEPEPETAEKHDQLFHGEEFCSFRGWIVFFWCSLDCLLRRIERKDLPVLLLCPNMGGTVNYGDWMQQRGQM